MQKIDEQLLELTKGRHGEALEIAIAQLPNAYLTERPTIWGQMLEANTLLIEEDRLEAYLEKLIAKYWQEANLFLLTDEGLQVEPQLLTVRLQQYLQVPQNKARLLQYLKRNSRLPYKQFLSFVFEKEIQIDPAHTGLSEIICFTINDKYLVQGIYSEQDIFWKTVYAKKMYSIIRQYKLEKIVQPIAFVKCLKEMLQADHTSNRIAVILHKLVVELDYDNPKTFELKQLHILNIVNHYVSGRRSLKRLEKCIEFFLQNWSVGQFKITEKEYTLIHYFKFMRAVELNKKEQLLPLVYALIEEEKLNTYSVEIFFEVGELLNLAQPNPSSIVKNYRHYYLEHVYALIVQTFVEHQKFEDGLQLLQQFELASSSAIFDCLNGALDEGSLAQIEATVQRDITVILERHPSEMMDAIAAWRATYLKSPKHITPIVKSTGKHVINILKVLFVTEQFDCFEKLMDTYKKYLEVPEYTNALKLFIQQQLQQSEKTVTI